MRRSLSPTIIFAHRKPLSGSNRVSSNMASKKPSIYTKAVEIIENAGKSRPGLVVLDLDYTIWPFWCEMYSPRQTSVAQLFPETREVIDACKACGVPMAVASRSPSPPTATAFLKALGLFDNYFEQILIIPYVGKDTTHFPQLRSALGVEYSDMLFFDDEHGNIRQVSKLGVTSILVSTGDGVSLRAFQKGITAFAKTGKDS